MATLLLFEYSNLDFLLQDHFFNFQTGEWIWDRDEPISKFILYDGIRALYAVAALSLFAFVAFFGNLPSLNDSKKGLIIVSISLLLIPAVVNVTKDFTNIPCPRDLSRFGGDYPHVTLLSGYPESFSRQPNVACFPAGHASGAFALLSLFFLIKRKRNRYMVVALVLVLAWSVGLYKMLIGDHFLSHTLVSMLLSWLLALTVAIFIDPKFGSKNTPRS